jgi:hypothetical protein
MVERMTQKLFSVCWMLMAAGAIVHHAACVRAKVPYTTKVPVLAQVPHLPTWPDTMHFYLNPSQEGVLLPDSLLQLVLTAEQHAQLHFDTGEAQFWAQQQFTFVDGWQAYLVQTEEFWFKKLNLLLFKPNGEKCAAVVTLAHFYGGDGGQTASESWLMRDKTAPLLFIKNAEHRLNIPDGADTPVEHLHELGQFYQWKKRRFQPVPRPDVSQWLSKFPMHHQW